MEREEVALFIDLENIRYSFQNQSGREVDFAKVFDIAKEFGRVTASYAYADFNEHPQMVRRRMDILGITCRDIPLRRWIMPNGEPRVKSSADAQMICDVYDTMLDRPFVSTIALATGDSDFLPIVTRMRNRFDKRVVVIAVQNTASADLVRAATEYRPLVVEENEELNVNHPILRPLVWMLKTNLPPTQFWTLRLISQWANDRRNAIPGDEREKANLISQMKEEGLLLQRIMTTDVQEVRKTYLNEDNPLVNEILSLGQPAREWVPTK